MKSTTWTIDEEKYLIENYPKQKAKVLLEHLHGRSWKGIQKKCRKLKLYKDNKWTKDEINYLYSYYPTNCKEIILKNLSKRTWDTIKNKASSLKIKRFHEFAWSDKEDNYLINNFHNKSMEEILSNLTNRTFSSIRCRARKYKLMRDIHKVAKLEKLLEETNEAYYWIGFILADGHISIKDEFRLILAQKDVNHLEKFKKFIEYTKEIRLHEYKGKKTAKLSLNDLETVNKLRNKFNIKHNKTYYPCNIDWIKDDDLLLSLIIGFIDGDGCISYRIKCSKKIRNDIRLNIVCHKSWFNNLNFILKTIYRLTCETSKVKVVFRENRVLFTISKSIIITKLKKLMLKLNIPYMERKWNRINENFISLYDKSKLKRQEFYKLYSLNKSMSNNEISKKLNIGLGTVSTYKWLLNKNLLLK